MPAWITSEWREEVPDPMCDAASNTTTSLPRRASSLATARPTTPAPTTTASTLSMPSTERSAKVALQLSASRCERLLIRSDQTVVANQLHTNQREARRRRLLVLHQQRIATSPTAAQPLQRTSSRSPLAALLSTHRGPVAKRTRVHSHSQSDNLNPR
jgi:hypothetical protein